ncbi:MAG: ATP-binding protein [Lachnospiraceae bacterium]|nr:ATP-binding protein [Lachnospiraceae bacterium]
MALRNSQYDVLIRAYNQKQLKNKHELDARTSKIYSQIPRVEEINREIATVSVAQAKELLNGNEQALSKLKSQIAELSEERTILLLRHGYPEDYLTLPCECKDCHDTGYIGNEKCHCFRQAAIDMLYTQSNLKEILETENFDTFSFDYYNNTEENAITGKTAYANMREIHTYCKQYVNQFGNNYENLLFYGGTGIGKTFLSNCIAKELLDRSFSVIYLTAIQLFDIFSQYTFENDDEEANADDMLPFIMDCDLLIIDDLGTELSNSFTNSKLFYCLNERFMRKKPVLISTNLTLDKINQIYSERIFSRLSSNFTLLKFYGEDIRIKKKLQPKRP